MKAAWYEKQGAARDVLIVGEMDDPKPRTGEVRIRIAFSGVNPGDVKKREDAFAVGMPYPRVIPHSDGSGTVDAVGDGVSREWVGRRVWCYGAQSYRAFGTAAEYTVVPLTQVVQLPERTSLEQGACLGIPGITAHRAVHVAGSIKGQTVLVQGGAGAVGACAVHDGNHLLFVETGRLFFNVGNWLDLLPLDEPRLQGCHSALGLLIQMEVINCSDDTEEILRALSAESLFLPCRNEPPNAWIIDVLNRGFFEQRQNVVSQLTRHAALHQLATRAFFKTQRKYEYRCSMC
jgi:hypothetical protein